MYNKYLESAHNFDLIIKLLIIFFAFPLLVPAINDIVIYPFLIIGLICFLKHDYYINNAIFLLITLIIFLLCAFFDFLSFLRLVSFCFGCLFLIEVFASEYYFKFFIKCGVIHALVVLIQFLMLFCGFELDFSIILKSVYGSNLPNTGSHIDYNAFSQIGIFFPRVAGINREPAYASVLFLGLFFISWINGFRRAAFLFLLAILVSFSKIVLVLIPVYFLISLSIKKERGTGGNDIGGRFLIIVISQAIFYFVINENSFFVSNLLLMDASFYHRFVGSYTIATNPMIFEILGSSWRKLSAMDLYWDYEFVNSQRAFFDGGTFPKLLVDFGWIPTIILIFVFALVSRNWMSALAFSIGGLFINLLSVSPATIITFLNICAIYFAMPFGIKNNESEN